MQRNNWIRKQKNKSPEDIHDLKQAINKTKLNKSYSKF